MTLNIRRSHELWGIFVLWIYDVLKYWVFKDLMESLGIDAHIFLFLDMVTVPAFIIGSARLVNSLAGCRAMAWHKVLGWGLVVLINTILPYAYAAAAGRAHFDRAAWMVFGGILLLILANMARTIKCQILERKRTRDPLT